MFAMYGKEEAERDVDEYMHTTLPEDECGEIDSYLVPVFEFIMTQYSLKAGLKKFGEQGEAAVTRELGQFHDMNVFLPMDPNRLTKKEKAEALASLIFLKEKKDGTVKARACADGRKQRETTAEEEAASPTVSIDSVFMTCALEASEGRDVAVIDLPGAFLHADCNEHVIMRFQGRLAS